MTNALNIAVLKFFGVIRIVLSSLTTGSTLPSATKFTSARNYALTLLVLVTCNNFAFGATRTASVTGNWNSLTTWGGASVPTASDDVTINGGVTVTVNVATAFCNSITFPAANPGNGTLTISGTNSLAVTGAITMGRPGNNGNNPHTINIGAGSLSCASITMGGTTTSRTTVINISSGNLIVSGNITSAGVSSIITFTSIGTLFAGGTFLSGSAGTFTASTGTVVFNGSVAQTVGVSTYNFNNIQIDNAIGVSLDATVTSTDITGNIIVNSGILNTGNYSVGLSAGKGLTVASGAILNAGTTSFTFNGSPAVNIDGIFKTANTTGFSGAAGTAISISGSPKIILGSSSTIEYTVLAGGQSITGRNYSNLLLDNTSGTNTAGGDISVTVALTTTAGGTLNMSTNALSVTTVANSGVIRTQNTLSSSLSAGKTWGGTVIYDALSGNQTVVAGTYFNLTMGNTSGTNGAGGNLTVNASLSLNSGTFVVGANTLTLNGPSITGTPANLSATSSSNFTFGGSSLGVNIPSGVSLVNNLTINNANGVTLNGSMTVSGILSLTSGVLNCSGNSMTLNSTGSYVCGGLGTINCNAGSNFTVSGLTATNLPPGTYQNLTINRSSGVSMCGNTTVNGILTLTSGTFAVGGNTLLLNGPAIAGTPGNLVSSTSSSLAFGGTSTGVNIPASVASLLNLTINNSALGGITLNGPLSIVGALSLTSGYLNSSPANFLTVTNTAVGSIIPGTGYINGPIARTLLANIASDGTTYSFPIGDGTNYRPLDLVNIRTGATNPVIMVTESNGGATIADGTTMSNIAARNWHVQTISGSYNSAYIRLTDGGIDYTKNVAQSSAQTGPYVAVGSTNIGASITSGQSVASNLYFAIGTATIKTYFSYQSGDWKLSSTWTRDPSGSFWINAGVPSAMDNVVILNGRTVNINENGKSAATLEIRLGGSLDLATYNGHNFGTVSGQGMLKLSTSSFPAGNYTSFVASDGGTVEYYNLNATGLSNTQLTYNNLIVSNYTVAANTVFLDNATNPINYILNGNLALKNQSSGSLTFYFGNSTPSDNLINMTIYGNVTVPAGCNIRVNNFASGHTVPNPSSSVAAYPIHSLAIYGNLINNGTVRFTGLPSPVNNAYYLLGSTANGGFNYGDVQVFFKGGTDNMLICNGITDFYRMIVEKGNDQSSVLEVISSNSANFALYAPNNQGNSTFNGGTDGYGWGAYYKALYLHYGTLKLNTNIVIPSLTEGGQDFNLIPTVCLWLNGATVSTTISGVNGTGYQAATLYGKLRISAGTFSTGDAAGLVLGTLGTPEIFIEGTGILDASQAWTAAGGSNLMSYTQTGGTANFRMQGENQAGPMLGLSSTNTVFTMSGGTLNFTNNSFIGGGINFQILNIGAQQGNYLVSGGTVNFNLPSSATTYTATSTVPFYNLNISRNGGVVNTSIQWNDSGTDLIVLNDLTLGTNTDLNLNTNSINLLVEHNFVLSPGATYSPGSNTTTFNGSGGQVFTNSGTITSGLNNFVLTNGSNTNITNNLNVLGSLTINNSCFLNDQGSSISVAGNIINNGTHTSQANGSIILNLAGNQTIGGTGSGIFGNFTLNKTGGTSTFTSNQSISGNLRLVSGILNINIYNLRLSASSSIYDVATGTQAPTTLGNTKMISTSGQQSDGGLSKTFNAIGSFLFPLGTSGVYHPGTITFLQAPPTWGEITVKPVAKAHPYIIAPNQAMAYYWKVTSNGFAGGLPPNSISHAYKYAASDVGGLINAYITGIYNPYIWIAGATTQVDKIANRILFPAINIIDGDYTAGVPAALGAIKVFYSRQNGDWDNRSTWSNVSNSGSALLATDPLPTADDAVVIGDGLTNNHIVTISTNSKSVGGLQINSGSTLDVQTTTGHNFGALPDLKVSGSGRLRISSAVATATFPSGDFGNFLGPNGGTVEYYTQTAPSAIGVAFALPTQYTAGTTPTNILGYANLILSPATLKNITLPNTDMTVFKDVTINKSGTSLAGITQLNNQVNTRTITINGNLNVNEGNIQYPNSSIQNIIVNGNVTVASGAIFDVAATNSATNTLSINGDLINNGTFDMISSATRICNVTFTGASNNGIKGTTATRTDFNILTVNKGVDRNSVLEATVNAFSLNPVLATSLTLTNGTFRLSAPLTISLTTSNPFTIPSSGCLSANIGTINIGSNNDAGDLLLKGRLEVMNSGVVNIGIAGTNFNNDIEYAAAGNPEINVSGGVLNVNGQIRRNTTNTLGSLWYNQSGGTITVRGKNLNNTRGIFEILNSGSQFNGSGGNLIIENEGSVSIADIYLNPEKFNITGVNGGHTLIIGNSSTPVSSIFLLNSSSPLWNLTVDATTNNKIVSLQVNNLSILNNLTINGNGLSGTGSVFKANELNVDIGGSLINNNLSSASGTDQGGYQAGTPGSTQTTTFTGDGQITGIAGNLTNFANLVLGSSVTTPVITLGASSNLRVNNDLAIISGTLSDRGNTITVLGDIANFAIHSSLVGSEGGIIMSNSIKQKISGSGNGHFGNLTINNIAGVNMVDDTWITGQLNLTGGSLYIDDYLLSLDVNATFSGFNASHMVLLNGVMSDAGVQKIFPGSVSNFVFPVGTNGNYRPATFSITSATGGNIKIIPVAQSHPADNDPKTDQLNYYWKTSVTGFSGLTSSTQVYQYGVGDINGNESLYHGALFNDYVWNDFGPSVINSLLHTINITSSSLIGGEYTAGAVANFDTKPALYSIGTGEWSNGNNWSTNPSGTPLYGAPPNGNPVFIQANHYITMDINNAYAYSVDVAGTLDLGTTSLHNLGYITDTLHVGTGTIRVQSTNAGMFLFPGGNYDRFMASPHSSVELYGSSSATMPLKPGNIYKPYQNLILTGAGIKYTSAENLKVMGNLTINNTTQLNNTLFNKNIYIFGNWVDMNTSPVTGGFVPGTGLTSFEGTNAQTMTIANAGITESFYDFRMKNTAELDISGGGNVQVANNLYLLNGIITTNSTNSLTLTNPGSSIVTGGSVNSFINGPLRKQINAGSFFTFPVGKVGNSARYGNIYLSGVVGSGIWEAEYFAGMPAFDITKKKLPVSHVSNNESWRINGMTSGSANVQLRWDALSGYAGSSAATRSKIRVVQWNPSSSLWEYNGKILNDASDISGTVTTDDLISLAPGTNLHYLTIGDEGLPTATITNLSPTAICNDGVVTSTVTVALTGTPPWSLTYMLGAVATTINNIASSPASIVLTSSSPGITGPGVFNFRITNVKDLTGTTGVTDYVTSIALSVNAIPSNVISGKTSVGTGEVVVYSTPPDAISYLWSLSSNGTVSNQTSANCTVNWGSNTSGPYTLNLAKTGANGCTVTNNIAVSTSTTPTPIISGNQYVCAGSVNTYSTPSVATHSYLWSLIPAGSGIIAGSGSSITVTWNGASTGNSVNVHEYVTLTTTIATDATLPVDIGMQPSGATSFIAPTSVCNGSSASIAVNNSEIGVRYQLRLNSDNSNVGTAVAGNGGSIVLTTNSLSSNTTYNIYAYTLAPFNCSKQLNNPSLTFTVNCLPKLNFGTLSAGNQTICSGILPNNIAFSTNPSGGTGTFAYQWYSYSGLTGNNPSGTSIPEGWTLIGGATSNNYTPPSLGNSMSYAVMVTNTGSPSCGSTTWASGCRLITVTPNVTINAFTPATSNRCQGLGTVVYITTANNSTGITYSLSAAGSSSIDPTTGSVTWDAAYSGVATITASAAGCNGPRTAVHTVTINPLPTATISYGSPSCLMSVTLTGSTGGFFSSSPAGLTINTVTGEINANTSTPGNYTVTYSIDAAGGCGFFTTTTLVSVDTDRTWTGSIGTDWNTAGNWSCNIIPDLSTNVFIPNVPNKPILSSGAIGAAKNILINSGSSLMIANNTLQLAGTITNNGIFTADNGTIEMKGNSAQTIPSGAFAGNNLRNLIVSNGSGVTLGGILNITGFLKAATGNLVSNGNLRLISSPTQTALIDGSGSGQVTGNVTMQRYLASGFGYKYFSSPFTSLTVNDFAPYVNLAASFPSFYKYNENNSIGGLGINFISGWVNWTNPTNPLDQVNGYAINFGNLTNSKTVEVTGIVSNGTLSASLKNNNRIYTTGFNLVGNPYPSPIDWNAVSGWTKTNIDNALYFFDASGVSDQFSGTYCSYVNGISTGGTKNIIPSMQGFFVHVSDGSFPVTGTLTMTNDVRINDFTTPFKSASTDLRTILRFAAGCDSKESKSDQVVLYFDPISSHLFDKEKDALKLINTDVTVPNIYAITSDAIKVSIDGIPTPNDSITRIPLGFMALKEGWINFETLDISQLSSSMNIYLTDSEKKIIQDLRKIASYRFYSTSGENNQRFSIVFSSKDLAQSISPTGKMFNLSRSSNQILVHVNLPYNSDGDLIVTNMQGQILFRKSVYGMETVEINPNVSSGVYIISLTSGKSRDSEKILIRKDYE